MIKIVLTVKGGEMRGKKNHNKEDGSYGIGLWKKKVNFRMDWEFQVEFTGTSEEGKKWKGCEREKQYGEYN